MQYIATIGTFDGVHRGHQYLLRYMAQHALPGQQLMAVTFTDHPLRLIAPDKAPAMLTSWPRRQELLRQYGVQRILPLSFSSEMRAMTAEQFMRFLYGYGVRTLVIGHNNGFGSDRATADYAAIGRRLDMQVLIAPEYRHDGHDAVSSSQIRRTLAQGDIPTAQALLGHPVAIEGIVRHGRQLGRTLGFPTANLDCGTLAVGTGVYAGTWQGHTVIVNIGRRPTVDGAEAPISVEAHIDGYSGDLYGQRLTITLLQRLRDERRFPDLDALQNQLRADLQQARAITHSHA